MCSARIREVVRGMSIAMFPALVAGALCTAYPGGYIERLGIDALQFSRLLLPTGNVSSAPSPVAVIAVDEESYKNFGAVPKVAWTPLFGTMIDELVRGGAAAIGLDIVFPTTLDRFIPGIDIPFLRALAEASHQDKLVLGYASTGGNLISPEAAQIAAVGGRANLAALNIDMDPDGVVRRYNTSLPTTDGGAISSIGGSLADRAGLHPVGKPLLVDFTSALRGVPIYGFADIVACAQAGNTDFFRKHFLGRIILIGVVLDVEDRWVTSSGLANSLSERPHRGEVGARCSGTPRTSGIFVPRRTTPGVLIHAGAIRAMAGTGLVKTLPRAADGLVVAVSVAVAASLFCFLGPLGVLGTLLGFLLISVGGATALLECGYLMPIVPACMFVSFSYVGISVHRFVVERASRRRIRDVFGTFLAPEVIDRLANDSKRLEPTVARATVMFLDVADYTTLTETFRGHESEFVAIMNRLLGEVAAIVKEFGGYVDKFTGDGVMAVWGVPLQGSRGTKQPAIEAAIACQELIRRWNEGGGRRALPSLLSVRIGLATGQVVAGLVGSDTRANYTTVGEVVNLASRLESANKTFGTGILMCGETAIGVTETIRKRRIGRVIVKGKTEPIEVYEVLARAGSANRHDPNPDYQRFEHAVSLFETRQYAAAMVVFGQLRSFDHVAKVYAGDLCKRLSGDWSGLDEPVLVLEAK